MKQGVDCVGLAVVPFIHDGRGNYLVSLRTKNCRDEHDCWEPAGGGGLKFGETFEAGIRREMQEEVAATPLTIEPLGHREVHREHDGQQTHWVIFDFRVEINPDEVKIMEPDKCAELRWCTIDSIPEPMHTQFPVVLANYQAKL